MMEMYGRAIVEERLRPQRFAEIAAYVRSEYGPGIGPEFLFADMAAGAAGKPRKQREPASAGVFRTLARAMKAIVSGTGNGRKTKASTPTR